MIKQPHNYYMSLAYEQASKANCKKKSVGCVLVSAEGNVVARGYNTTILGHPCNTPTECNAQNTEIDDYCNAIHAEQAALINRESMQQPINCYTTVAPCIECAKLLAAAGVKAVFYDKPCRQKYPKIYLQTLRDPIFMYDINELNALVENITNEAPTLNLDHNPLQEIY